MTFLSFSAALLYFETPDELLHLYTPEHVKERVDKSGAMHVAPEDGRRLIEVPFARAAQPFLALMLNRSPSDTIQTQREQQRAEEQKRCQQVVDALNERSREVLRAITQGLHPREVADALHLDSSTISYYAGKIYRECRNAPDGNCTASGSPFPSVDAYRNRARAEREHEDRVIEKSLHAGRCCQCRKRETQRCWPLQESPQKKSGDDDE